MSPTVSVRPILGATTKDMLYHVAGRLEDIFPSFIILHHGSN